MKQFVKKGTVLEKDFDIDIWEGELVFCNL